jgi:hypothetical protein
MRGAICQGESNHYEGALGTGENEGAHQRLARRLGQACDFNFAGQIALSGSFITVKQELGVCRALVAAGSGVGDSNTGMVVVAPTQTSEILLDIHPKNKQGGRSPSGL